MKRKIKFVMEKEEEEEENTSKQLSHALAQVDGWRDWSGLPIHLLYDIADNLTDIADSILFGRVCGSWRSVSAGIMNNLGSPLLLVASPDGNDNKQQRALYSPSTDTISNLRTQLPHSKICRGFSFGWLITMEQKSKDNYHIQLRNIFLNREINLPTLDNIAQLHADTYASLGAHEFLYKAALSSDPSSSNRFIVMGIMTRYMGLAFVKPGDQLWTSIPGGLGMPGMPWRFNDNVIYVDIIFFHRAKQFYTVLLSGVLIAIEFQGGEPKLIQVAPRLDVPLAHCTDEVYLVEDLHLGDLLQVRKRRRLTKMDENRKQHKSIRFLLFKFDHMKLNWIEIHNLGGKVLFVGCNSSLLSSASDCPGCKPNCIYYVTDPHSSYARPNPRKFYTEPPYGGIYNLEDRTVQPNYLSTTVDKMLPLGIWIDPTLSKKPP